MIQHTRFVCQYYNQFPHQTPSFSTAVLTQYVEKFVPNENLSQEKKFCDSLQGYTSSYNKIDLLLKPLVETLNQSHKCQKICFYLKDKVKPLYAVFSWIKKFDYKKINRAETKHNLVTPKPPITQLNEIASNNRMIVEDKKKLSEEKEINEQNTKIKIKL